MTARGNRGRRPWVTSFCSEVLDFCGVLLDDYCFSLSQWQKPSEQWFGTFLLAVILFWLLYTLFTFHQLLFPKNQRLKFEASLKWWTWFWTVWLKENIFFFFILLSWNKFYLGACGVQINMVPNTLRRLKLGVPYSAQVLCLSPSQDQHIHRPHQLFK